YFEFNEESYRIVGRRSGIVYTLGDPVKIKVKATNIEQKLLDYELVETGLEERIKAAKVAAGPASTGSRTGAGAAVKTRRSGGSPNPSARSSVRTATPKTSSRKAKTIPTRTGQRKK
ncbi:MAG: hypothetical protein LUC18_00170, partial [Porphyromonadaceae bacterium]|nr:hypothetical protein [Porphyromonadaceae bacterium]